VYNPWYPEAATFITPYRLLNLRNRISDNLAYFVVLAQNETDVEMAVKFGRAHRLDLAVFSTGHEFNDRNAGRSAGAALLIRTTCLRRAEFDLSPDNRFGAPDGVVRLGAGLTWGRSKFGAEGVHQMAAERERVVVSGHAGEVGIVGWSLGGGHGQLVGTFGLGVDQVLEVELVAADGSTLVANAEGTTRTDPEGRTIFDTDTELFWALRGGGAGPWGIVTALTIKLHRNRNNCTASCFFQSALIWEGDFSMDDGQVMEEVMAAYLAWTGRASRYWSSYGTAVPGEGGKYYFLLEALYVGREEDEGGDFGSFEAAMPRVRPERIVMAENKTFDTFLDKMANQSPEHVDSAAKMEPMVSVFLNASVVASQDVAKTLTRLSCFILLFLVR
jgi:FAD/FMN-containing dehydrogenase